MSEHRHILLALALLAALAVGCASNDVGVSAAFDPLTAFPRQATYSWDDAANSFPDEPGLRKLDLDRLIVQTANEEFGPDHHPDVPDVMVLFRTGHGPVEACRSEGRIRQLSRQLVTQISQRRTQLSGLFQ